MKVRELIAALAQADPDANVSITVDAENIPEGEEAFDLGVMGTADDGDIFDIFTQPHSSVGEEKTYEFFGYTERSCFEVKASSEEEARAKLADAPFDYRVGGYGVDNSAEDFDLNSVTEPEPVKEDIATLALNRIIEVALDMRLDGLAEQGVHDPAAREEFKAVQQVRDKLTTHDLVWEARS